LRGLPLSIRKTNLARLLVRRPDGIFVAPFEEGKIGPDLFRAACEFGRDRPYRDGTPLTVLLGMIVRIRALRLDRDRALVRRDDRS
jgi:hypothetical protein